MKNLRLAGFLWLVSLSIFACHKEDPDGYDMDQQGFLHDVHQIQVLQRALIRIIIREDTTGHAIAFANDRMQFSDNYLQQLKGITGFIGATGPENLSAENMQKVNQLKELTAKTA